jgi:two-component system cell cycle sensor histidine kinase/response regulator CckA
MAGTILIIDDEEGIREMLTDSLEDLGYAVASCKDGVEAVDFYRAHQTEVGIVILDMTMPRMSGAECFTQLQAINPAVKVIVSTGGSFDQDVRQMRKQGVLHFIPKPVSVDDIVALIDQILAEGVA